MIMVSLDTSLLELLRGVRVDLARTRDPSTASLARPRARLAWIASLIPPECAHQRHLLDMAAQVAAEIGLGDADTAQDTTRLRAAVAAVNAVVESLANPASHEGTRMMDDARQELAGFGLPS